MYVHVWSFSFQLLHYTLMENVARIERAVVSSDIILSLCREMFHWKTGIDIRWKRCLLRFETKLTSIVPER